MYTHPLKPQIRRLRPKSCTNCPDDHEAVNISKVDPSPTPARSLRGGAWLIPVLPTPSALGVDPLIRFAIAGLACTYITSGLIIAAACIYPHLEWVHDPALRSLSVFPI